MNELAIPLHGVDRTQVAKVGGKAACLGELARLDGVNVPRGFCLTTDAYETVLAGVPSVDQQLERLARLDPENQPAVSALSERLRRDIARAPVPRKVAAALGVALTRAGGSSAFAVRSSATTEDLPTASFAGQHDSYLNVRGPDSVLQHVRLCWASLFTERAVTYRLRAGMDPREAKMAVVVQQMVQARSAGVVFTADPVSSDRTLAVVEATLGLGDCVVSGGARPDVFRVRRGKIVGATVTSDGGAPREASAPEAHRRPAREERSPALTRAQVLRLVQLARRIEAHFGSPQDIEWCMVDDAFLVVQSRAVTALFPVVEAGDGENHVYVSVGHQQMMTDAMKPLGISFWLLTTRAPMREAGGRLFVDVTESLASPSSRQAVMTALGRSDPRIENALERVLDRGDFIRTRPAAKPATPPAGAGPAPIETDPDVVTALVAHGQASLATLERDIRTRTGPALFDFILEDLEELKRLLGDPRSRPVILAAIEAAWWLNEHLQEWLGEKNPADTLAQSVPGNVTSEMGLALMGVADAIRPHAEVVAFLRGVDGDGFMDELPGLKGGSIARDAVRAFLDRYGMRCVGEIDITRPRWSERPSALLPLILSNVARFEAGEAERHFERGRLAAARKEQELVARLRALPEGERKAEQTQKMIRRLRAFSGYREYPKYGMVSRYFVYKQALLAEARRWLAAGVLRDEEDIYFLTFSELQDVARTHRVDGALVDRRKREFRLHQVLTPPRVITSDGECLSGAFRRRDVPPGALVGLPVSAGVVEGRARVIFDFGEAELEVGDILVTVFTDPSWTPAFVGLGGLVAEVGGMMTHGAVIAREYGLPAVVGVDDATRLIRDGQRIRVNGTEGCVELLS